MVLVIVMAYLAVAAAVPQHHEQPQVRRQVLAEREPVVRVTMAATHQQRELVVLLELALGAVALAEQLQTP